MIDLRLVDWQVHRLDLHTTLQFKPKQLDVVELPSQSSSPRHARCDSDSTLTEIWTTALFSFFKKIFFRKISFRSTTCSCTKVTFQTVADRPDILSVLNWIHKLFAKVISRRHRQGKIQSSV